jgi:NAD(P)-dependent dehydrogenase (short-subunit alcohol dehydrogenase family)
VYATDVRADAPAISRLSEAGCETARLDVTDRESIARVVDRIREEATGVDCLVNVAGIGTWGPIEEERPDDARRVFTVNVHGTVDLTRAVLPGMRARNRGRVVTVTSVLGEVTPPGLGTYSASKHALEALTDALRREVRGFGVDVVAVQPAWVRTGFAAAAREGDRTGDATGTPDGCDARSRPYRRIGALDDRLDFLGGGPLAVDPDRVARTVRRAAEVDDPRARYRVGTTARALAATRWLPARVLDYGFDLLGRVAARLD